MLPWTSLRLLTITNVKFNNIFPIWTTNLATNFSIIKSSLVNTYACIDRYWTHHMFWVVKVPLGAILEELFIFKLAQSWLLISSICNSILWNFNQQFLALWTTNPTMVYVCLWICKIIFAHSNTSACTQCFGWSKMFQIV